MNSALPPLRATMTGRDWFASLFLHAVVVSAGVWIAGGDLVPNDPVHKLDLPIAWTEPVPEPKPEPPKPPPEPQPEPKPEPPAPKPKPAPPRPQKPAHRPQPRPVVQQVIPEKAEESVQAADVVVPAAVAPAAPVQAVAPVAAPAAPEVAARAPARSNAQAQNQWRSTLDAALRKDKRYPTTARRMRQEGTVMVQVVISASGEVVSCSVAESSGFSVLDNAAMQLVRAAAAVATASGPPEERLNLRIPVVYELKNT